MTIHGLVEAWARATPEAMALVYGSETTTYGELNRRANRLAHVMRARGVGPGTVVAVGLPPAPEMVAALLAILKTGATYLSLNLAYPADRLHFLVEDCGAPLLVTTSQHAGLFGDFTGQFLRLEDVPDTDDADPDLPCSADAPAFVCYTSGSTGRPKGVLCTHENVINRFRWFSRHHPFVAGDVACLRAETSAVIAMWELFSPLLGGAALLLPGEARKQPAALLRLAAERRVTHLGVVPSFAQLLVDEHANDLGALAALKVVEVGGEAAPPGLLRRLMAALPPATLIHRYGATEMTAVICNIIAPGEPVPDKVPAGRAIDGTEALVLDSDMRRAEPGTLGDLHLGGAGLAVRYLGDEALTAERFIEHDGRRLYRTGDLARVGADGTIELVGRRDFELNIAGHRVAPGEIEGAIASHPTVRQAVVCLHRVDGPAGVRDLLVAHVVRRDAAPIDEPALRQFLRRSLPSHMVPDRFEPIDTLPLLPGGKIDRRKIAGRPVFLAFPAGDAVPRGRLTAAIEALLGQALDDEALRHGFLDLGGTSLVAMRLIARLQSDFGIDLPVADLINAPSMRQLIQHLEREQRTQAAAAALLRSPPSGRDGVGIRL
jgi:amino acid adenylation domain-containing protein